MCVCVCCTDTHNLPQPIQLEVKAAPCFPNQQSYKDTDSHNFTQVKSKERTVKSLALAHPMWLFIPCSYNCVSG